MSTCRTSEQRPDARHELVGAEWLRNVVVGADLETGDPLGLLGTRREHDDRDQRRRRVRAGRATDFGAVNLGQHEIEHQEVRRASRQRGKPLPSGRVDVDSKPCLFEVAPHEFRDVAVVLDDQNPFHLSV